MFNRFLSSGSRQQGSRNAASALLIPPVNVSIDQGNRKFRCEVALPGVDPKDVTIQVQGNTLSIEGEYRSTEESQKADYVQRELMYGSFERDIVLPEGVEADNISAEYRNGVLEITAPISAAALPRRIEIKGGQEAKRIAAGAK